MKESVGAKKRRILKALLMGRKITSYEANRIGKTTEGGRMIRFIREKYPVIKEPITGEVYYRYYIDKEWLSAYRKDKVASFTNNVKSFFCKLF